MGTDPSIVETRLPISIQMMVSGSRKTGPGTANEPSGCQSGKPTATAKLIVGSYPNTDRQLLEQAVTRLRTRCPELAIEIVTDSDRILLPRLRAGTVDVVLGREPSVRALGSLHFQPIYEEALIFVTRPQHPLAFRSQLYPLDLGPYPLHVHAYDAILVCEAQRYLSTQGLPLASVLAPDVPVWHPIYLHDDRILITALGAVASAVARLELARLPMDRRVPHHRVGLIRPYESPAGFWITQLTDVLLALAGS